MNRKENPDYIQLCGYLPKELVKQFKIACLTEGTTQAELMEQILTTWLSAHGFKVPTPAKESKRNE